jgi:hypothetical protein
MAVKAQVLFDGTGNRDYQNLTPSCEVGKSGLPGNAL